MDVTHEFIEEIEKGNNTIFTEILNNFYKDIYSYTYRQVEDVEDAKDLTQDIFIKVYKKT